MRMSIGAGPAVPLCAALGCTPQLPPGALPAPAPATETEPSGALMALADSLDAYLRSAVEQGFSGVALVARGDEILLHQAYSADPAVTAGSDGLRAELHLGRWRAAAVPHPRVPIVARAPGRRTAALTPRGRRGDRAVMGANPRQLVVAIFSRAAGQIGVGLAVGAALARAMDWATGGAVMEGHGAVLLPAVSALMLTVGLLAALGPARRGLRIQPTEALRAES